MDHTCRQLEKPRATLGDNGCGNWGAGVAGVLMFLACCPMGVVAAAAPYWTASDSTGSGSASLWKVSRTAGGVDADVDMCGDEMQGFDECVKIHAVRFFTIAALVLSLASSAALLVDYLPVLKAKPAARANALVAGTGFAAATFLLYFLSVCVAASVDMSSGGYSQNGAGFVFLILSLLWVPLALLPAHMERVATLVGKMQMLQATLVDNGCGHWGAGVAGVLMFLVCCPMSVGAVAAPYWTASERTSSGSASLWTVSMTAGSVDADVDMCGDDMQSFDECGKIHAVRFLTISALLLSLASAAALLVGYSPVLGAKPASRWNVLLAGTSLAAATLLLNFLGVCVVASVDMAGSGYSQNGAGFFFAILSWLLFTPAIILSTLAVRQMSSARLTEISTCIEEARKPKQPTTPYGCGPSKGNADATSRPTLMSSSLQSLAPRPKS